MRVETPSRATIRGQELLPKHVNCCGLTSIPPAASVETLGP